MFDNLRLRQPNFFNQAFLPVSNGNISHAYLIETNDVTFDNVNYYINLFVEHLFQQKNTILTKEKLKLLLDNHSYPDLIEVYPNNGIIKKDQLLSVMNAFKSKSMYNDYQIYVIYEADKMNSQAANTILKFLEEPSQDIIGIFVTSNRYRVINTILSRCQILTLKHEIIDVTSDFFSDDELSFFRQLYTNGDSLLLDFNNYYENLFKNRELALMSLNHAKIYFKNEIEQNCDWSNQHLFEIVSIIEEASSKIKYNVNLKLWLDEMLLRLSEVSYENC